MKTTRYLPATPALFPAAFPCRRLERAARWGLAVVGMSFFAGCVVKHEQWRQEFVTGDAGPYEGAFGDSASEEDRERASGVVGDRVFERYGDDFTLAHIEFDDQGQFWHKEREDGERNQLEALEKRVADRLESDPGHFANGVIMVTFVHGWSNNSKEGNDNLRNFRYTLAKIAEGEREEPVGLQRPVIGVYLSWRGARFHERTPLGKAAKVLSYWDRKETAENIGRRSMGDTLKRLSLLRDKIAYEGEGRNRATTRSYSVIAGHSFGGAAVFSGVASFFEHELADARASDFEKWVSPNWNLVVLVNPAFEALQYSTIHRYASEIPLQLDRGQSPFVLMPRMLVVASEADSAVKGALPLGQRLGDLFRPKQDDEQRALMMTGLGHYPPYNTHHLSLGGDGEARLGLLPHAAGSAPVAELRPQGRSAFLDNFDHLFLDETPAKRVLPFMVATADPAVIGSHGDIWNEKFREFIVKLIHSHERAGKEAAKFVP